jgi:iron-sulfur cluster repair protein YtfE (RIC family)
MAKRHPSLVALSHDHHHGLALALRLRQGDVALLTDGWIHDRHEQAKRVAAFYRDELRSHFLAEERSLFPAMRQYVPVSTDLIDRLVLQHRQIEEIIERVSGPAVRDLAALLVRLGEVLELHIRAEERELFPLYEEHVPDKVARDIQAAMDLILVAGGSDGKRRTG